MRKVVKAKIVERSMFCTIECPYCEAQLIYDATETYLIVDGVDITCPYCKRRSSVETSDYLSQLN